MGYWLLGVSGMVAGMVSVGGLTRLTKSGLAMTEWNVTGRKPPMNPAEWETEFARYKTFPEWQQRQSMTVDEFKFIFWCELSLYLAPQQKMDFSNTTVLFELVS